MLYEVITEVIEVRVVPVQVGVAFGENSILIPPPHSASGRFPVAGIDVKDGDAHRKDAVPGQHSYNFV